MLSVIQLLSYNVPPITPTFPRAFSYETQTYSHRFLRKASPHPIYVLGRHRSQTWDICISHPGEIRVSHFLPFEGSEGYDSSHLQVGETAMHTLVQVGAESVCLYTSQEPAGHWPLRLQYSSGTATASAPCQITCALRM